VRLSALRRLTLEQRSVYDIKNGFQSAANGTAIVRAEQSVVFASVDAETLAGLCGGFGDHVLDVFERDAHALIESDFHGLGRNVVSELRAFLAFLGDLL